MQERLYTSLNKISWLDNAGLGEIDMNMRVLSLSIKKRNMMEDSFRRITTFTCFCIREVVRQDV